MEEYITVKEAAGRLNVNEQTIRNYIYEGRLESKKIFNSTVINVKEIERYERQVGNGE